MFWDRLRRRPMWLQIAWNTFISFGVLHLLVGVLVLVVMIRHHLAECDEIITLATEDLVREYKEYGGDASRLKLDMVSDVESHGNENLFLLVSSPSGRILVAASSSESVLRKMFQEARKGRTGTYRFKRGRRSGLGREISIRARNTPLPDGNVLSVGYNITDAEYNLIHVAILLGSAMLMTLFAGAFTGAIRARKFTAPLRNLVVAAEKIASGDYSARVLASAEGWEITRVEEAFNKMGDKNEAHPHSRMANPEGWNGNSGLAPYRYSTPVGALLGGVLNETLSSDWRYYTDRDKRIFGLLPSPRLPDDREQLGQAFLSITPPPVGGASQRAGYWG